MQMLYSVQPALFEEKNMFLNFDELNNKYHSSKKSDFKCNCFRFYSQPIPIVNSIACSSCSITIILINLNTILIYSLIFPFLFF